jgi:hypothetical protein
VAHPEWPAIFANRPVGPKLAFFEHTNGFARLAKGLVKQTKTFADQTIVFVDRAKTFARFTIVSVKQTDGFADRANTDADQTNGVARLTKTIADRAKRFARLTNTFVQSTKAFAGFTGRVAGSAHGLFSPSERAVHRIRERVGLHNSVAKRTRRGVKTTQEPGKLRSATEQITSQKEVCTRSIAGE